MFVNHIFLLPLMYILWLLYSVRCHSVNNSLSLSFHLHLHFFLYFRFLRSTDTSFFMMTGLNFSFISSFQSLHLYFHCYFNIFFLICFILTFSLTYLHTVFISCRKNVFLLFPVNINPLLLCIVYCSLSHSTIF